MENLLYAKLFYEREEEKGVKLIVYEKEEIIFKKVTQK
jgi:hypothetical protein